MIALRPAQERGHANHGWLDTWHSFSFADYHDPAYMGFGPLRVINDDRIAPAAGFPMHGHRDMEILTYLLEGALQHRDSLGNGSVIRRGEVQRMSAGRGIVHSEFNASPTEPAHLLQVWIMPDATGIAPGYEQVLVPDAEKRGRLRLIASPDPGEGRVSLHQDARVYAALLGPEETVVHEVAPGRIAYLHVARGRARLNDQTLSEGDGAGMRAEPQLIVTGEKSETEILLFDLPT